jgi:FkbM family methyltransferase
MYNKTMKPIVFDVGTNTGDELYAAITSGYDAEYYAFEPVPEIYNNLLERFKEHENVKFFQLAVSNYKGQSSFNVSNEQSLGEVSSLLEMVDNVKDNWGHVAGCFEYTHKIDVDVITLESFIEEHNIPYITYLHVDAQGSDLNVLKGLGSKMHLVQEGTVEAAIKYNVIYKNQCMIDEVVNFLEQNNFEIVRIDPNDQWNNEANIRFKNKNFYVTDK